MHFKPLHAFLAIMVGCVFAGCHSEIDLQNIDKTAELEMGLAMPIGSIHATMGPRAFSLIFYENPFHTRRTLYTSFFYPKKLH